MTNARDAILLAVRSAGLRKTAAPDLSMFARTPEPHDELVRRFIASAEGTSAVVSRITAALVDAELARLKDEGGRWVSALASPSTLEEGTLPHSFDSTDVFVCHAGVGVAENGAVWLPLSRLRYRSALFLAQRVVVLLHESAIVADLHAAYDAIDPSCESYGLFVAGPSKTADIEQALVVGAHGPKALTLLLIDA